MNVKHCSLVLAALCCPAVGQGADDCSSATPISGRGLYSFDTRNASTDGTHPATCALSSTSNLVFDVWYAWTAEDDGNHIVSLCGTATGNSKIAIYGSTCGSPILACNDNACLFDPEVTFEAVRGESYLIRIGNAVPYSGAFGTFSIQIDAPAFNPDNGHYYERAYGVGLTWTEARDAAASMDWLGQPGHLVTFNDEAEFDWILQNLQPTRAWIGMWQDTSAPTYSEPAGGFGWVTGEPITFTNWVSTEPNNGSFGGENYVEMLGDGRWNDVVVDWSFVAEFIVEWDGISGVGTNYCTTTPNSAGAGSRMSATGSLVAAENDLTLVASGLPLDSFGYFLTSRTQGFVQGPGGSLGDLCLGGTIGRYVAPGQVMNSAGFGEIALPINLVRTPQAHGFVAVLAGESWNFQHWHRDGAATSNFTDGLQLTFL